MSRKKNYIIQVNDRDRIFCQCLRITRMANTSLISANRLQSYVKQGVIERVVIVGSKVKDAYRLTESGKRWINANIDICRNQSFYSTAGAVKHDYQLAEHFAAGLTHSEQLSAFTEHQARDMMNEYLEWIKNEDYSRYAELQDKLLNREISPPDFVYVCEATGNMIAYECVTSAYSSQDIHGKIEFCKTLDMKLVIKKI